MNTLCIDAKKITPRHTKEESSQLHQGPGLPQSGEPSDGPLEVLEPAKFLPSPLLHQKRVSNFGHPSYLTLVARKRECSLKPHWKCLSCLKTAKFSLGIAQQRRLYQLPAEHWSHGYAMATMVAPMFRGLPKVGLGCA